MTAQLTTQTIQTQVSASNGYAAPAGNMLIPLPSVMMAKPLSYEFRVVEYMEGEKIQRVALQVQIWEHDNYGVGYVKQDWTNVERVQLPSK